MSPEDLAARHPRLYHLTAPDAVPSILRHGLLPTRDLLTLFEAGAEERARVTGRRRPASVRLTHPVHGCATITDNSPLHMAALARCLDDGLSPEDWLAMLNGRVFFWADETGLASLSGARLNRGAPKAVLVFDTLGLARACHARMDLSPINSGATIRRAARRGHATFTPLGRLSYEAWRRQRGGLDRVREVTIAGAAPDAAAHLRETRVVIDGKVDRVTTCGTWNA